MKILCGMIQRVDPLMGCLLDAGHENPHEFQQVKECPRCGQLLPVLDMVGLPDGGMQVSEVKPHCDDQDALFYRLRGIHVAVNQLIQLQVTLLQMIQGQQAPPKIITGGAMFDPRMGKR